MAHNISQQKRDELDCQRRRDELQPYLVPGWKVNARGTAVEEINTVLGAYQRKQSLFFRCGHGGCARRVEVNLQKAVEAGLGDKSPQELIGWLRCRHWAGCRLELSVSIYLGGVPLIAYLNNPGVLIVIVCDNCGARIMLAPRTVIDRLKSARRGDGSLGVKLVGQRATRPCKACHARRFSSDILWPPYAKAEAALALRGKL